MTINESKEKDKEYPTKVWNILDDFYDLWLVELSNELPLMHNILLEISH